MARAKEKVISLMSTTTVDHSAIAATTLYTVPTGFRWIPDHVKVEAAGDEAATIVSLGQVGALTDFLGNQTLSILDAQYDVVTLQPIPNATPVLQKSYAAGTVFQVNVTTAVGNAANTYYLFGNLQAV